MNDDTVINDGGPAFPRPAARIEYSNGTVEYIDQQDGMSLRDYFAGEIVAGIVADGASFVALNKIAQPTGRSASLQAAIVAYDIADAMLMARARR